ncbi:unnamed protein product, partial [marine sediment metagenome]
ECVKFMNSLKVDDSCRRDIRQELLRIFKCAHKWEGVAVPDIDTVKVEKRIVRVL